VKQQLTKEQIEFCVAIVQKTMKQRGYSQTQMEELSGVQQSTISKVTNHAAEPSYETLEKLVQALGLSFRTILSDAHASPQDLLGYLATPLTSVVADHQAEAELSRVVVQIKSVAAEFEDPKLKLYWPGEHTHPTRNPDFTASQVYLTDRSRASTHDFIVLFCGSPSYGVGQENEIATQAGLPAIRLVPTGLSRMMAGSFINTVDVPYKGSLNTGVDFDLSALRVAFEQVKKLHFRHLAFFKHLNGNDFGKTLRKLVDERCNDYRSFADDIGVNIAYLQSLMDEGIIVSNPSVRLLKRMACRLGVTVGYLLGEVEEADAVLIASLNSWDEWINSSNVDAKTAMDIRYEWKTEYLSGKALETSASFRRPESMTIGDWEKRLQKLRGTKGNGSGNLF
jgi:transcriptional regulator with XRE-family HTH domain